MLETNIRQLQNPSTYSSSSLLAFKPRQVVLAQSSKSTNLVMAKKQQNQENNKSVLHQSILHYLHRNGYSKTLKYFLKETQIEGDSWKSCSLSLEDLYSKYLNNSTENDTISKGNRELVQCEDDTNTNKISSNAADTQETISKKKKKKKTEDKNSDVPDASLPESVDKSTKDATTAQEVLADDKADVPLKKQKEKKKKKTEEKSESVVPIDNDNTVETTKKDKKKKSKEESGATDSKDSKKRKRLASDENANQENQMLGTEESKRRKTEGLEESKAVAEQEENGEVIEANSNGNHQDELNNSAKQKSSRKEFNGSAEPKTVNAFQRVKIDQVEFKDDRLKDNSYWAKDGADIGYGAKAQEVLGQVKGRNFRHEKTKKKRGSYRGGIIDLNSHSVKFNYDEE
ncbi:hypothetical protein RND71_012699 [Anisodus tanguticus]|uniref:LisH domain-containing protein n=1 Tax=Anisodus tanguticus TaxID=243964 RepID=A0AAE1SFY2_9SOLA|nr:hypothetical protein RND71_012699 [Anisodus tanguticus]